jgi:tetratricopeptide (TPR) repeat protein
MKALKKISVLVITVLSLTVGFCYSQGVAEQFRRSCYTRGVGHAAKGNFNEAKEEFEKALKFDPYYESAKRAVKIIEDALDQKIKNTTAVHLLKGIGYEEKELWDDSISEFNLAIEINPRYAEVYCIRSIIYIVKGQHDKAISDLTKAIELNPIYADAYNNRGIAYAFKGQFDMACSDWRRACELGLCISYELSRRNGDCK